MASPTTSTLIERSFSASRHASCGSKPRAVDTHTEGRIAARLRNVRGAHTTLVATTSPLMLEMMDLVYFMVDGRAIEQGTHRELIATSALYRQVVLREDS